ncbi:MAG TPA: glycosyltransferase family 2 protein [Streptosporangiaceae bacterium]|nr:glycosyltransferase family 2 protein [Streptosporangiaceae bacterium]
MGHHRTIQRDSLAARRLLSGRQLAFLGALAAGFAVIAGTRAAGLGPSPLQWAEAALAVITISYVSAIGFMVLMVFCAGGARTVRPGDPVPDDELPLYTVMVHAPALSGALPDALIGKLSALDYPRLQVLLLAPGDPTPQRSPGASLLAGEDDTQALPPWIEVTAVPPAAPHTTSSARDAGLDRAAGEFCVVYDAEDLPAAGQLRDAVAAFRALPAWVVCLQAELRYINPGTNWLARCFAAEYAISFGLFLRGLDRLGLVIPLSSTSHHFRTEALQRVGGWDAYNASEGTDLGVRIARRGWGAGIMASVTNKEASGRPGDWLRQRTRWMTGYYQTWLVHMRSPGRLWRDLGTRRFFGLQLTFAVYLTALINPLFWALTLACLVSGRGYLFLYTGGAAMLLGNLLMAYSLMIGCMEHGLFHAVRTMLLVPVYWALMSVAAYRALLSFRRREAQGSALREAHGS